MHVYSELKCAPKLDHSFDIFQKEVESDLDLPNLQSWVEKLTFQLNLTMTRTDAHSVRSLPCKNKAICSPETQHGR